MTLVTFWTGETITLPVNSRTAALLRLEEETERDYYDLLDEIESLEVIS